MNIENRAEKAYEANISASIDSKEYDFLWWNLNERSKTTQDLKKIRILKLIKDSAQLSNFTNSEDWGSK